MGHFKAAVRRYKGLPKNASATYPEFRSDGTGIILSDENANRVAVRVCLSALQSGQRSLFIVKILIVVFCVQAARLQWYPLPTARSRVFHLEHILCAPRDNAWVQGGAVLPVSVSSGREMIQSVSVCPVCT